MKFYLAPLEGVTGYIFRNALDAYFPGERIDTLRRSLCGSEACTAKKGAAGHSSRE